MSNIVEKIFETEEELLKYSKTLEENTLRDIISKESYLEGYSKGKGSLGQTVEKLFFGYNPNSKQEADFEILGRELKVAPLKKVTKKSESSEIRFRKGISAKERIVLTIIDYMKLVDEEWENNSMKKKIKLLIMFYLHDSEKTNLDLKFKLIDLWEPSEEDIKIIKSDWEKIREKVLNGEAHNISEGDTSYLGACTKGSTAEKSLRKQPRSEILAKQRAFSLKNSYVNSIVNELLERKEGIVPVNEVKILAPMDKTLEEALNRKFSNFFDKNIGTICKNLNLKLSSSKNFYSLVLNKILGGKEDSTIIELEKAGVKIKVIRIDKDGKIPEHISFPAFDFIEISKEEWEDSSLKETLETTKYLFVVLKMDCTNSEFRKFSEEEKVNYLILEKVFLWNMPMEKIEFEAKKVWEKTKEVILNGIQIREVGKKRFNNFPEASESECMHVRPHAKDREDTKPLPNGGSFTKQSFWFNKEYIEKIIAKF